MKIKNIVCGIISVAALAFVCIQYDAYQNQLDESYALRLKIDIRDQQISEMEDDLESAYGEFEFNFGEQELILFWTSQTKEQLKLIGIKSGLKALVRPLTT